MNGYPLAEEVNPARLAREKVGSHVGWHRFVLLEDLRLQNAELQINKMRKRVAQAEIVINGSIVEDEVWRTVHTRHQVREWFALFVFVWLYLTWIVQPALGPAHQDTGLVIGEQSQEDHAVDDRLQNVGRGTIDKS